MPFRTTKPKTPCFRRGGVRFAVDSNWWDFLPPYDILKRLLLLRAIGQSNWEQFVSAETLSLSLTSLKGAGGTGKRCFSV